MKVFKLVIVLIFSSIALYTQEPGLIENRILKTVVNIDEKGSGFIVLKSNKQNIKQTYLVTNKHMIGQWSLVDKFIPNKKITVFLYSRDAIDPVIPVVVQISDEEGNLYPYVKIHPNPKIDIAIINITEIVKGTSHLGIKYLDPSYLIKLKDIGSETQSGIGSLVFAIGYPAMITSKNSNLPIIKSGFISSSLTGDLKINTKWKNRENDTINENVEGKYFLVDGLIIGGNSGGPIVHAKERKYRINELGQLEYSSLVIPNLIFGIVSFGIDNTGISVVFAADHIIELLDKFD